MTTKVKFPPSVEIKRAIAAATKGGIPIDSIAIEPRKITINFAPPQAASAATIYDQWKASERTKHSSGPSDGILDRQPKIRLKNREL